MAVLPAMGTRQIVYLGDGMMTKSSDVEPSGLFVIAGQGSCALESSSAGNAQRTVLSRYAGPSQIYLGPEFAQEGVAWRPSAVR